MGKVYSSKHNRRGASSSISSGKKKAGHAAERDFADVINGSRISGTKKGDVIDSLNRQYSVKNAEKHFQIFLYNHSRLKQSTYLKTLTKCLDAFPADSQQYFEAREKCLNYKLNYLTKHGRSKAKQLTNHELAQNIGHNLYLDSKTKLSLATLWVVNKIQTSKSIENFLNEAIFNNNEVEFLAIRDIHVSRDRKFKVFHRDDVLRILASELQVSQSAAGRSPKDLNIAGQKILFRYQSSTARWKNLIEIEVRNDDSHYREVRCNMKASDTLQILVSAFGSTGAKKINEDVMAFGIAANLL